MRTFRSPLVVWLVCVAALAVGCDRDAQQAPAVRVADDDARMAKAIADARASVGQFRTALQNPKPEQTNFAVKYPAKDGDVVEHLWVTPVRSEGGRFVGTVGNDPERVSTVRLGQDVTIAADEISDWMYVDDGALVGGYTLRVLRDAMNTRDRRELDKSLPFRID
jgi:uncharacterized protein YegJ (DUF2314 family)